MATTINPVKQTIRIASRDSLLAIKQAEMVMTAIRSYDAELETILLTMKTQGDVLLDRKLDEVGGKGLFVKELDDALTRGECDISVHSLKDMPIANNSELPIVALSAREDPRDVLVLPLGAKTVNSGLASLTDILATINKPIGCSSERRVVQLRGMQPNIVVKPIRGNVPTRLRKLDEGEFGALVLAAAGLNRLGFQNRISKTFELSELLPAAGQGIIAVQAKSGINTSYLQLFNDTASVICANAERTFTAELGADCFSPVAAYATLSGKMLRLRVMVADTNLTPTHDEITVELMADGDANPPNVREAAIKLARRFR